MSTLITKQMTFYKNNTVDIHKYMNSIFLYSMFNDLKYIHYPSLHNVSIQITSSKYVPLYNIPADVYTVKFPPHYCFAKDVIVPNRNIKETFTLKKQISLDVCSDTNEMIGYYTQDVNIDYISFYELHFTK